MKSVIFVTSHAMKMKLFHIVLFVAFAAFQLTAQDRLAFDESGFKSVMVKAKEQNKIVLYMLYADWCPHCNKMKAEVFTDPKVISFLSQNFVCGWQNVETGEGPALRKKLNTKLFPYFVFINPDAKIVYAVSGELKSEDMIREATAALDPKQQIPYLEQQFLADPGNPEKCVALLTTMRKGYDRQAVNPIAHAYFETVPDAKMVSEINWKIMANGVADIESREFQYMLKHQKEFAAVSSAERVDRKIMNAVTEAMQAFGTGTDTVNYKQKRDVIKAMAMPKTDSLVFRYDLEMTSRTGNKQAYRDATSSNVKRFAWKSAPLLKEIAKKYAEFYTDSSSLNDAIAWIDRAIELDNSVDNRLTKARLYFKMGKKKEAVDAAKSARSLAQSYGFSTADADALILSYEK